MAGGTPNAVAISKKFRRVLLVRTGAIPANMLIRL